MFTNLLLTLLTAAQFSDVASHRKQDQTPGTCKPRVMGLRFNDTKAPHSKSSWQPMIACRKFADNTCCSRNDTEVIQKYNLMGSSAGHSETCQKYTQEFNCMPCHGDVGTGTLSNVCANFCTAWYDACRDDFFKTQRSASTLRPCFGDYLICSPLSSIVNDGRSFCETMGLSVSDDASNCYDGTPPTTSGVPEVYKKPTAQRRPSSVEIQWRRAVRWLSESDPQQIVVAFACLSTLFFLTAFVLRRSLCGRRSNFHAGDDSDTDSDVDNDEHSGRKLVRKNSHPAYPVFAAVKLRKLLSASEKDLLQSSSDDDDD